MKYNTKMSLHIDDQTKGEFGRTVKKKKKERKMKHLSFRITDMNVSFDLKRLHDI